MELIKFEVGQIWIDSEDYQHTVSSIEFLHGVAIEAEMGSGRCFTSNGQKMDTNGDLLGSFLVGPKSDLVKDPEFEYPIFKRWIGTKGVSKFTSIVARVDIVNDAGIKIVENDRELFIDYYAHTQKDRWEDIYYNEERGLADKEVVIALIDGRFQYRLYDAKNDTLFYNDGKRNGLRIYRLYTEEEVKKELLERANANN